MSIGSIGGTSSLNQAYLSQQAQSVLAASFDPQRTAASTSAAATGSMDASSNTLTGVNTPTLDSQTLQALMDLTQQDPAAASDPSSTDGSGQASQGSQSSQSGQAQGAHHRHHHHGAGQAQASDPSPSQTAADATSSTDAFGVSSPDADGDEDPLAQALSQA